MSEGEIKFHFSLIATVTICLLFKGVPSSPVLHEVDEGQSCLHVNRTERPSPSKHSRVPSDETQRLSYCLVDWSYPGLDIYPCDDFFEWSVKRECLMCGVPVSESRRNILCPDRRKDDPERGLSCEYCKRYANPCQNGGIALCGKEAYASELQCKCANGYSGRFCENFIEEVKRVCTYDELDDDPEAMPCTENQLFSCNLKVNGRSFKCRMVDNNDEDSLSLPRCDDMPIMLEELLESSADGSSGTHDDDNNIPLQSSSVDNEIELVDTPLREI